MDVRETLSAGQGLQEYTTLSNDGFLKTANCVELHTMSEFEDVRLTFRCSESITLPILENSDLSIAATAGASCEMLEFDAETAGPG